MGSETMMLLELSFVIALQCEGNVVGWWILRGMHNAWKCSSSEMLKGRDELGETQVRMGPPQSATFIPSPSGSQIVLTEDFHVPPQNKTFYLATTASVV
jgi:hypothetical protein